MSRFADTLNGLSEDESEDEDQEQREQGAKKGKTEKGPGLAELEELGYKSGPSVLLVPDSAAEGSWTWGKGERTEAEVGESLEEREHNREAAGSGAEMAAKHAHLRQEQLAQLREKERAEHAANQKDRRQTFQQREKRKRDMGQAKKAKNYVEEEKRQARNLGVYSGFDT